ncbi:predicted protein [Uncinocarpus reesii 1704]|uniref:AAA+ ATPase domain-containing protein n=1 Tax=Uncinocarpus reesii (strain UAMH 1704) TaxID=336963 RepID=C4JVI1_UNCRE|nr:uncharacterized protein UREG_06573 [Uncinocarpus reesii 1704]EEP81708.1 predicted protein [Uncinocarpus reesii 1704]
MASSSSSGPPPDMLLEALIPGYSLFSRMVSLYTGIDISLYSVYILLFATLLAFALFVVPVLLDHLRQFLLFFAASLEVKYHDPLYRQILQWVSDHDSLSRTRHSIAGIRTSYKYDDEEMEKKAEEEKVTAQDQVDSNSPRFWQQLSYMNRVKPIRCTPTQEKLHVFTYKGSLVALHRDPQPSRYNSDLAHAESLRFYAAPWNQRRLRELLYEIQELSLQRECNHVTVHRGRSVGDEMFWESGPSMLPRDLSTVILDEKIKTAVVNDIKIFLSPKSRNWYRSRCYPYRRGFLFHGPPGTGKSSMCFAIASLLRLDIYTVSFNSKNLDEDTLASLLQELPKRCVLLIEDIDSAGIKKRSYDEDEESSVDGRDRGSGRRGISLSALLNAIDGVGAQEGRILIMTTNHKNVLDAALLRPGRVDMEVSFGYAEEPIIQKLFLAFYGIPDDGQRTESSLSVKSSRSDNDDADFVTEHDESKIRSLAVQFAKQVPAGEFTPAEIQNYFFIHRETPDAAVAGVSQWVKSKQEPGNRAEEESESDAL